MSEASSALFLAHTTSVYKIRVGLIVIISLSNALFAITPFYNLFSSLVLHCLYFSVTILNTLL